MSFPSESFERLAAIEPGHFWFESRNALIAWAMRAYFPRARTLLEVGCGTGFVLQGLRRAFPHLAITASDALPGGLETARQRVPDAEIRQQDARAVEDVARFDVACAFDVIEHVVEDDVVLRRLHAAVVPGGGLIVTVPQHQWLWSDADEYAHHVRRYSRRQLQDRIETAGFEVIRTTSFVSLLLPLMVMSRLRGQRATAGASSPELQPPAAINALLRHVLTLERQVIRLGASWPAGGSLLAIARKRAG